MLKIVADTQVIDAVLAAVPEALIIENDESDDLNLDPSSAATIGLKALLAASKALWLKLMPFVTARPEMEMEFEGPGGRITLKMKNVTEQTIVETAQKVMLVGSGTAAST